MPEEYKQKIEQLAEKRARLNHERQNLLRTQLTEDEMAVRDNTRTQFVPQVLPTSMQLKVNSDLKNRVDNQISETLIEAEEKQKQKEAQERFANMTDREREAWVQEQRDKTEGLSEADSATDWYYALEKDPQKRAEWDKGASLARNIGLSALLLPYAPQILGAGKSAGGHMLRTMMNPANAATGFGQAAALTNNIYWTGKAIDAGSKALDKAFKGENLNTNDYANLMFATLAPLGLRYDFRQVKNVANPMLNAGPMFGEMKKYQQLQPNIAQTLTAKLVEKTLPTYRQTSRVWDSKSNKYVWKTLSDQEVDEILSKFNVTDGDVWHLAQKSGMSVDTPQLTVHPKSLLDWMRNTAGNPSNPHIGLLEKVNNAESIEDAQKIINDYAANFYLTGRMFELPAFAWGPKYTVTPEMRRVMANQLKDADNAIDLVRKSLQRRGVTIKPMSGVIPDSDLSGSYSSLIDDSVNIGLSKNGRTIVDGKYPTTVSQVAAHEAAHLDPRYNLAHGSPTAESPMYGMDYSSIPLQLKKLMKPTTLTTKHNFEFNEGVSDKTATQVTMALNNISFGNLLDPTKRYSYWDLIRYKLTPQGMTDRFIKLRGGWWKGWNQQLDALNSFKNGGTIIDKTVNPDQ